MTARDVRGLLLVCALPLALLAAGCGGSEVSEQTSQTTTDTAATQAPSGTPTVDQAREAGNVAREIEAEPNRAAEILAQHGMTAEQLEALIFEIARDPQLTAAYEEARRAGSSG